jgi:hypothetical protein
MQPVHIASDGMIRFKANPIVRFLLDENGRGRFAGKRIDMNDLTVEVDATEDERAQFAELIGYSIGGYSGNPSTLSRPQLDAIPSSTERVD